MLNSERVLFALNDMDEDYLESARIRLGYRAVEAVRRPARKRIAALALAAALILALCAAAYAADLFGVRALLMKNAPPAGEPGVGTLSLTQPQDVPEGMDDAIRQKIDNSTKAWAEWDAWRKANGVYEPEVFAAPEGTGIADFVENDDGTVTVIFYATVVERDENGKAVDYKTVEIERRTATAEEYRQEEAWAEVHSKGYGDYDYNYFVYSEEMGDRLEEIAASYGLRLRHKRTAMYQNVDGHTEFSTRDQITAKINEVCAGGKSFFRTEPTGYDKFYYFDEGTFAVSFYATGDLTNTGTSCYLYNSPYGTLSSGFEIRGQVKDIEAFAVRSHTAPDGTELTVLQKDADMYAYVYLENSFVTLHITQLNGLTDEEIDAVLDMVDYSAIR
ncbi:MAG: hypothetical protein IJQ43_01805 [Oscillospiraceae bacterium]|nr:hypothetical protein [Oscillospiraceae bacterium]